MSMKQQEIVARAIHATGAKTMKTLAEVQTALDALLAKMVERGLEIPNVEYSIYAAKQGFVYMTTDGDNRTSEIFRAETIAECFALADEYLDALPSAKEAVTHEYLKRVASAVDYATENSIADEYVAPLRGVSCAMTENLLTHEEVKS